MLNEKKKRVFPNFHLKLNFLKCLWYDSSMKTEAIFYSEFVVKKFKSFKIALSVQLVMLSFSFSSFLENFNP